MIIYKITNKINGMIYIGQTINNLDKRWKAHCRFGKNNTTSYVSNAIQKYGINAFCVEEIGSYSNLEDLNNAEEYFIDWFNCLVPNGYNIRLGGNYSTFSLETRQKMSKAKLGKIPWNKDIPASEET